MSSKFDTEDRTTFREFLRTRFSVEDLKDLAFDLGIPYEPGINKQALSRELVEYCERKDTLGCLIARVISLRPNVDTSDLGKMLGKLPPCEKQVKVQVISSGNSKELPPEILRALADWANTTPENVVLIGAAPGSIRLLISLSEEKARVVFAHRHKRSVENKYEVESIKNFAALPQLTQLTWRVLIGYFPFSSLELLETDLSWRDISGLIKRGQAAVANAFTLIPKQALLYYYGGIILLSLKSWDSAVFNFNQASKIKPDFAEAYLRRGIAYFNLRQYESALADFETAIKYDPGLVDAYNYRGALYAKQRKYNKALVEFARAIHLNPASAISYTNHGSALYHLGKYRDALTDFNKAISLDPSDKRAYVGRGFILAKLSRNREALEDFNRAIELDPYDAKDYVHRGIIYERLGHVDEALRDFQHALQLDPKNAKASSMVQEMNAVDESAYSYFGIVDNASAAPDETKREAGTAGTSVDYDYSDEDFS